MATEEPAPVLTLKERIAALKLAQAADNPAEKGPTRVQKAPIQSPPTLPRRPTSIQAPARDASPSIGRVQSEYSPRSQNTQPAPAPAKQNGRKPGPPSLPPRRQSQQEVDDNPPALPPRRPSELSVNRKNSIDSISSVASGRSSISAVSARASFSAASESNPAAAARSRIKAPLHDPAKLPALPERRAQRRDNDTERRDPPNPTKSSPNNAARVGQPTIRSLPSFPSRRQAPEAHQTSEEAPPKPARPALEPGFGVKASPSMIASNAPKQPTFSNPAPPVAAPNASPAVVELDANTFDNVILRSGKPSFVDFYAPFCKYCKELDPVYDELAVKYQHTNITIARIDSYGQKSIGERYQIEGWPTLKFFDGTGGPPLDFKWMWDMEWMSRFIDQEMEKLPALPNSPPPVPLATRPTF